MKIDMKSLADEEVLIVNQGKDDEFSIQGYKENRLFHGLFYVTGFCTAGFLFLLGYWMQEKRLKFTHDVSKLSAATKLIVSQGDKKTRETFICDINVARFDKSSKLEVNKKDYTKFESDILKLGEMTYFEHLFLRYYFTDQGDVKEISGIDGHVDITKLECMKEGLQIVSVPLKQTVHGENVSEVSVTPFFRILLQLAADPFYIFQLFSVILWFIDNYYTFTIAIILMSVFSLLVTSYETRTQMKRVRAMTGQPFHVNVLRRDGHNISTNCRIMSSELVPGDVLVIPTEGLELPCDAVILDGNCVVNESALTGETFPVTKSSFKADLAENNGQILEIQKNKENVVYHGTKILQAYSDSREGCARAIVFRTGFATLKGRLIRSIVHPKPIFFASFRDSMRFIMFLAILGVAGMSYSLTMFVRNGADVLTVFKRTFDIITIIVPPILPACMSIGLLIAVRRLKKLNIYCIDPQRLNHCGKLKLFVFDKTGTLTEDELSVAGVIQVEQSIMQHLERSPENLRDTDIVKGMACCHSLCLMNNEVNGNPLDCSMFKFSGWSMKKKERRADYQTDDKKKSPFYVESSEKAKIRILKEYPFSSALQRMSVIVQEESEVDLQKHCRVFTKGSPESIKLFCRPDTIPETMDDVLTFQTRMGFRVLAIAVKDLIGQGNSLTEDEPQQVDSLRREIVESDLTFLGLIVFENQLKPQSRETMRLLQKGNIRTIMATGDNLYTAASVARDVNIIKYYQKTVELRIEKDHLFSRENQHQSEQSIGTSRSSQLNVSNSSEIFFGSDEEIEGSNITHSNLNYSCILTGATYRWVRKQKHDILSKVLMSTSVFARMSPDDKSCLVEDLKTLGYNVGMCGDGANDCGALKEAHAGIALSDSEASVAAPFTSKVFDISCVPHLIREGRAALVTSFGIFNVIVCYSFIQSIGVLILYSIFSTYSDWEFTFADIFLGLPLVFALIQSGPEEKIHVRRPVGRLVHPLSLLGIFLQILIAMSFQVLAFFLPRWMSWYRPPSEFDNTKYPLIFTCYENYSLILISFFQNIWISFICSTGKPYRKPLYKNVLYIVVFVVGVGLTVYLAFKPATMIREAFKFPEMPSYIYSCLLISLSLFHFYLAYMLKLALQTDLSKTLCNRIRGKIEPKNLYKRVYKSMVYDLNWPPNSYETSL